MKITHIAAALILFLTATVTYAEDTTFVVKEHNSNSYKKIIADDSKLEELLNSGLYQSVEEEVWALTPKRIEANDRTTYSKKIDNSFALSQSTYGQLNDPDFEFQYYFMDKSVHEGSSEILKAKNKSNQNKKLRIAVIDGGFEDHEDLDWAYGYNFFDMWGEERGPEFRDLTEEQKNCSGGHGLGVASIIGAKSNNGIGMAGVVDADMIALRAMSCGLGPLSAVADAILHASGEVVDDIPAIEQVDLINISMAGEFHTCPSYLQSAIDIANEKGIMIFVAAGNQNIDANGVVPALCSGIYVAGASDQQGYKATFSNFGSKVNAMMAGVDILGYTSNGATGWWEGTSQASPLSLGIAALGLQHNPMLTRDQVFGFLEASATEIRTDVSSADQDCSGDRCGAGLLNADKFMDYVLAESEGELYKLAHALSPESTCSQELYISSLGNSLPLCQMYELTIGGDRGVNKENYQVVKVETGNVFNQDSVLVVESTESSILLDSVDLSTYDYGIKFCTGDSCSSAIIMPLNTYHAETPAICD
jgi:subtilisin family serine protease